MPLGRLPLPVLLITVLALTFAPAGCPRAAAESAADRPDHAGRETHPPRPDPAAAAAVRALINRTRAAARVGDVRVAPCPRRAARSWARRLTSARGLAHQDASRLLDCPHTKLSGETLARRFRSPRAVLRAWLASAAHREVLLDGRYDRIGVAVIRESGGLLVVADFIAP